MDTYEGSIYDPNTLHKYLYANGNPVKYSDPSGDMFGSLALGVSQQAEESKINQVTFNIGMTLLKKALRLSDAYDAKVIIKFQCNAIFVDDIGVVDSYVRQFVPLKSYFLDRLKFPI